MNNQTPVLNEQTITLTVTRVKKEHNVTYNVTTSNGYSFHTHYSDEIGKCVDAMCVEYKNLKPSDIQTLLDLGYLYSDMPYIDSGVPNIIIYYYDDRDKKHRISRQKARKYLGEKCFWASMGRAKFHVTSSNDGKDENGNLISIHFERK